MFSRHCLPTLCSLLLVPASASAAPFSETPLETLRGEAHCVLATGDPDTLTGDDTVSPDGGAAVTYTAGGSFAEVNSALPLILADGTPALARTDRVSDRDGYRLHLAAEGASPGAEPGEPTCARRRREPDCPEGRRDAELAGDLQWAVRRDRASARRLGRPRNAATGARRHRSLAS